MLQAELREHLQQIEQRMARELGAASDGDLAGAIERLRAFDLEKLEHLPFNRSYNCAPCIELADLLRDLDSAASELSDWLARRYFTHVGDVSRQTMAL